jgi:4-amino-4-deoxy-L-arabinose transferase-like glycosyltransferase
VKRFDGFPNVNLTRLLGVVLIGLLVIVLINALTRDFDHDEFEAVHSAWKILNGEKIYVDFFQHHHPLLYYLLAPVIAMLGESSTTLVVLRLIFFLLFLLMLLVTYHFSARIFNNKTALICTLLLCSDQIFVNRAIEIRPDVPQTLFGLLSLFLLLSYLENKNLKHLISSSLCLAISFLFLQKTIFLIILTGCLLLINVYKKRVCWRDLSIYLLVFLSGLAPYFLYLLCSESLSSYFTFNWLINTKFVERFTAFNTIGFALRTSTLLCVFYVLGLCFTLKTVAQKYVGAFSLGLLASTFLFFAPYKQDFMMAMPLIAATAASAIYLLLEKKQRWMLPILLLVVTAQGFSLLKRANNYAQLKTIDYVLSVTNKNDRVYDGDAIFNLFRKDIDFFWYSLRPNVGGLAAYKRMTEYKYDIYESIDKFKPKVISSYEIENMQDKRITEHYTESSRYKGLFIRTDRQLRFVEQRSGGILLPHSLSFLFVSGRRQHIFIVKNTSC